MSLKVENVVLEYQNLIPAVRQPAGQLFQNACANDDSTVNHWRETWLKNIKANKARFGNFSDYSVGKLYKKFQYRPAICAGSGPSLAKNVDELRNRQDIPLISCLHNFHYFEDKEVNTDIYVTLDAGPVTIEEVYEGGLKTPSEYWELTKNRTLLAYIATDPELLSKWKGEIYFYNASLPNEQLVKEIKDIENFAVYASNGGNVLGTCAYMAKAVFGCYSIIFIGADFSFGYPKIIDGKPFYRFHPWDCKYNNVLGTVLKVPDIFGNKIITWQSYYSFKNFFDWLSTRYPGDFINATEGGCMGAYMDGNLDSFRYMDLKDALKMYHLNDTLKECFENPQIEIDKILY